MLKSQEWQCFHADQWINLSWRFVETSMDKPLIMGTCIRSQFITTWTGGWLRLFHYESILEVAGAPF